MSKLLEYLKLIPSGIKNIDKVIEGIINEVKMQNKTLPEDRREEIIKRRVICHICPYMSVNAGRSVEYLGLTGKHYATDRIEPHCTLCNCPILTKTASLDSDCGATVWNSKNPGREIELRWFKYNKDEDGKLQ